MESHTAYQKCRKKKNANILVALTLMDGTSSNFLFFSRLACTLRAFGIKRILVPKEKGHRTQPVRLGGQDRMLMCKRKRHQDSGL